MGIGGTPTGPNRLVENWGPERGTGARRAPNTHDDPFRCATDGGLSVDRHTNRSCDSASDKH
jgi:hypothetical protein